MDREKRYEPLEVLFLFTIGLVMRLSAGRGSLIGETVLFDGYDPYYHMRRILYSVDHFPDSLWFDSYINYPNGLDLTWPPLFDQIVAGTALIFGQHSQHGVEIIGAVIPPLLGALTVIVIYYLIREAFDRNTALLAGFMAALAPYHISKTILGSTDHHALEVLTFMIAVLFLALALSRQERRHHFAVVSGVFIAALAYTWIGASAYVGIILAYAAVQMTADIAAGRSSKEVITPIIVALLVSLVLVAPFWSRPWMMPSFMGIGAIAAGAIVLFAISRVMVARKTPWVAFPVAIIALLGILTLAVLVFDDIWVFSMLKSIVLSGGDYIFGGSLTGMVAEAEPLLASMDILFAGYGPTALGWTLLISLAGIAVLALKIKRSSLTSQPVMILILVWSISTLALTLGQLRFLYIYSLAAGVLISILYFSALDWIHSRTEERLHPYLAVLLLLVLALPFGGSAISSAVSGGSPQIAGDWHESLVWLRENTETTNPDPSKTPEYSVLTWWDYGNWVIYVSERPVVANNFQTGVIDSANVVDSARFYLSENEEAASRILDSRSSRYVITDQDMLYGIFPAITRWVDEDPTTYYNIDTWDEGLTYTPKERLYETTLAKLHFFEGSGMGRFRLIYESRTMMGTNPPTSRVKIFEYVPGALIRIAAPGDMKVGAMLNLTSNQGRPFKYINIGSRVGDGFEIRVPYSTEGRYETHAAGPYSVFTGNQDGITYMSVNVSENDVLEGKVIDIRP